MIWALCTTVPTAPFLDSESAPADLVGMQNADHLLSRFLMAAVVVDNLVLFPPCLLFAFIISLAHA